MAEKELKELEQKVAQRVDFLKKVTDFVEMISSKRGRQLLYSQGSCHTHQMYELCDFSGFSFRADTGQSMMGGNTVEVWYHPVLDVKPPVLDIYWQVDIEKCELKHFDETPDWQREILIVIQNWEAIATRIDEELAEAEKRRRVEGEIQQRQKELEEQAKRLHVL